MPPATFSMVVVSMPPRALCPFLPGMLVRLLLNFLFHFLLHVGLVRLFTQRCEVCVCRGSVGYGKAHGPQHGIFFCLFQLSFLFGELVGGGLFFFLVLVAFRVPVEIAALLPAAHSCNCQQQCIVYGPGGKRTGHEGVSKVVLTLRILLDIFPLEVGAAAAD